MRLRLAIAIFMTSAFASADVVRATTIRPAAIYLSPDTASDKLADLDLGREVICLETRHT
jgi:hypothetical protein